MTLILLFVVTMNNNKANFTEIQVTREFYSGLEQDIPLCKLDPDQQNCVAFRLLSHISKQKSEAQTHP